MALSCKVKVKSPYDSVLPLLDAEPRDASTYLYQEPQIRTFVATVLVIENWKWLTILSRRTHLSMVDIQILKCYTAVKMSELCSMHQQDLKITILDGGENKQITKEYIQQDATYIKFKILQIHSVVYVSGSNMVHLWCRQWKGELFVTKF